MDYPSKEAVLVKSEDGLPIKGQDGYLFRLIGTTDQYMYCDEGYNYILYFDDTHGIEHTSSSSRLDLDENTTVDNESDEGDNEVEQNNEDNDSSWDDSKTKFLLSLYKEYIQLVRNRKIKTKAKMWERIQTSFHNKKFNFSAKQIENRFKTLERRYKHLLKNNKATGRGKQHFQYKKELDEIFENDPKILPEMLMSAGTTILKEDLRNRYNIGSSSVNNSKENVPDVELAVPGSSKETNQDNQEVESATPKKKVKRSVDILLELKNDLKVQFKQKETDREKKIKLIEERNNELKRKNDLFEKYMKLKFHEQEFP